MNQVKDIFNTQFFVILGVVLLIVTCLVLYIEQKFKAYDHKMSSMLSLVSSLAEEMDIFKNKSNFSGGLPAMQTEINDLNKNLEESKLIDVSDDEDDSDDDDDSESETDSETDSESVDDLNHPKIVNTMDLGTSENEIITITKLEDLQSNNIVELDGSIIEELNDRVGKYDLEELDNMEELDDLDNSVDLDDLDDLDDDETNVVEELDDIEETNVVEELDDIEETNVVEELDDIEETNVVEELDDIDETNVVEELDDIEEINNDLIDYNKLSVAKLKEIALDKNLISNTSNKLKKIELLKMLEDN